MATKHRLSVTCGSCGKVHDSKLPRPGQTFRCQNCGVKVVVPAPLPPKAAEPEAEVAPSDEDDEADGDEADGEPTKPSLAAPAKRTRFCKKCDKPQTYDRRGLCRGCGVQISFEKESTGPKLEVPKTWGELWPTIVFSGILLVAGVAFIFVGLAVGVAEDRVIDVPVFGRVLCNVIGWPLLGCAINCWRK